MRSRSIIVPVTLATSLLAASASAGVFSTVGFSENFDSMGTTGTSAPAGFRHFTGPAGSNNATWTASIPASGANSVASIPVNTASTVLVPSNNPSTTQNNGFNAARSTSNTANRVLATSPTTVAGSFIQLELQNSTGITMAAGTTMSVSFDTVRFNSVSSANQLPGYWLFLSTNGSDWTNLGPNPTNSSVPNTVGVSSSTINFNLPNNWLNSQSIFFRWVDDNATQTSPDQIIGLDNVSIIPTPSAAALLSLGLLSASRRRR